MADGRTMIGDPGPYMAVDGPDIWVPRTVPYLEARRIAKSGGMDYDDRLVYIGKENARLLGFTRECQCEEVCELFDPWDENEQPEQPAGDADACMAPAWHFRAVER
jgi:hypothetical protein